MTPKAVFDAKTGPEQSHKASPVHLPSAIAQPGRGVECLAENRQALPETLITEVIETGVRTSRIQENIDIKNKFFRGTHLIISPWLNP